MAVAKGNAVRLKLVFWVEIFWRVQLLAAEVDLAANVVVYGDRPINVLYWNIFGSQNFGHARRSAAGCSRLARAD